MADGSSFLLVDDGKVKIILVFAEAKGVEHGNRYVEPVVFANLPNKEKETYYRVVHFILKSWFVTLNLV